MATQVNFFCFLKFFFLSGLQYGDNKGSTYLLNCKVKIILRIMLGGGLTDEVEVVSTHGNVTGEFWAWQCWL